MIEALQQRYGVKLSYVYLRPANLICFRAVGAYGTSAPHAWEQMFLWLNERQLRGKVKRGFGLSHFDPRQTSAEKCRYEACIDLPDCLPISAWEHMLPQKLPGGAYARFRHVGSHTKIGEAISEIRNSWIDNKDIILATGRPLVEIYLDDPMFCPPDKRRTDLCLPVAFADEQAPDPNTLSINQ
ncbi:MAG: GyrI-like domain-containing protein [Hyphomicrobiaceae bacterium]